MASRTGGPAQDPELRGKREGIQNLGEGAQWRGHLGEPHALRLPLQAV